MGRFAVGIMTRWTPEVASRGRAGTGRDHTGAVGVAGTARAHLGSADLHRGALVLLPRCAVPDKNEFWIVSLVSSHVEEAALGKSDLEPSADWEPTLILISGALFLMPRLLQKSYCCGVYCVFRALKEINGQNHLIFLKSHKIG